ncbi:TetR/AcrR family transcriptional regulator [Nocardioides sp. BP30]|uniref:TetR/AcrR family transcriptional regulator n=1 Tax=Nocardioides sp. BP30 TaxID=3036374 RepID=UPI0024691DEC|nr:TetR/AcrR family transcriptional regulator [Nocardioides sp. BP30]WGL53352.1 TetR/AcrR family transcriptional regulator [Nocardioides sp. BP30]
MATDARVDPRAERTRRQIRDAVVALAGSGAEPITVSAVARAAGVNRSSFYAHFDSLEDVACSMLDESLAEIADLGWRERATPGADRGAQGRRDLLALVGHVSQHRAFYAAVLARGAAAAPAQNHVASVLRSRFEESFLRYGALEIAGEPAVTAASIGVGAALAALVTAWLRDDLSCSAEELAAHCAEVFPEWTRRLQAPGATTAPHDTHLEARRAP